MRYAKESQLNLRDLGGYKNDFSVISHFGKLLRGDCNNQLTINDLSELNNLDLDIVLDLRELNEVNKKESVYKKINNIKYINIPLGIGSKPPNSETEIPETYLKMFKANTISEILKIISAQNSNLIFHCTAGKDRTGIVTAIILKICNFSNKTIIQDYNRSDILLKPLINKLRNENPNQPKWLGRAKIKYMEEALKLFDNEFPSIIDFYKFHRLKNSEITNLKNKLLNTHPNSL